MKKPNSSTILGKGKDRYAFEARDKRFLVAGLAQAPDLLRKARGMDPNAPSGSPDRETLNSVIDEAMTRAGVWKAANEGSAKHTVLEVLLGDEGVDWLEEGEKKAMAKLFATLDAADLTPIAYECPVYVPDLGCAGRFDLIVRSGRNGRTMVADLKTGAAVWPGDNATQLATYAAASHYYTGDDWRFATKPKRWYELPNLDQPGWVEAHFDRSHGIVIHLPFGTDDCSLHLLPITEAWEWAKAARGVYDAQAASKKLEADTVFRLKDVA